METPIRDQIRLDNLWQAQRISTHSRKVFVPAPWQGSEIQLVQRNGVQQPVQPLTFTLGTWNQFEAHEPLEGARLVALPPLHLKRVESRHTAAGVLMVQIDLKGAPICSLHITLSAPNGQQVAGSDLKVRESASHVRANLDLPVDLKSGSYRLKVVMAVGDQIFDNARTDVLL